MYFINFKKIFAAVVLSTTVFSSVALGAAPVMATGTTDTAKSDGSSDNSSGEISWPKGPKVESKSAVLMDVDSGTVQ